MRNDGRDSLGESQDLRAVSEQPARAVAAMELASVEHSEVSNQLDVDPSGAWASRLTLATSASSESSAATARRFVFMSLDDTGR